MCRDCGCGLPGENPVGVNAHSEEHAHEHEGDHGHAHEHSHEHEHGPGHHHGEQHEHAHTHSHTHPHRHSHSHEGAHKHSHTHALESEAHRIVEVRQAILGKNDRLAERNRGFFHARGLLVLNVLSSPGSGKTTFLRETVRMLAPRLKAGVIVGDLATDNDAERLRQTGAPVVQITTGTVCHLEAEMVGRAVSQLELKGLALLIIENVGNLVCPAAYDLGEDLRIVLWSVTEGEDKPLKYPPMFQSADAVVISKIDLAAACDYNRDTFSANLRRISPNALIFETSAKTGKGLDRWCDFLQQRQQEQKTRDPLTAG